MYMGELQASGNMFCMILLCLLYCSVCILIHTHTFSCEAVSTLSANLVIITAEII